jgi:hypothetical protein
MKTLKEQFSAEVETFLKTSGMTATGFGRTVFKDPGFVFELREGRKVSVDIIDRARAFMRQHTRAA